jgi:TonB family protein
MQKLKAVIIIRIQPDGSISASWFEKESGDRLFDQSAMTAVTRSSPLPALPPGQEKLEIGITFTPEWKASS